MLLYEICVIQQVLDWIAEYSDQGHVLFRSYDCKDLQADKTDSALAKGYDTSRMRGST